MKHVNIFAQGLRAVDVQSLPMAAERGLAALLLYALAANGQSGASPATGSAICRDAIQHPDATILDLLDGSSVGNAYGLEYVELPGSPPGRLVASLKRESRIEYDRGIPAEGTLEWSVNVAVQPNPVPIFSIGSAKVLVSANGGISLLDEGTAMFEAERTPFRFGAWHAIGVSYGGHGAAIEVDGEVVASTPTAIRLTGTGVLGGFTGSAGAFRASNGEEDWWMPRSHWPGSNLPRFIFRTREVKSPPQLVKEVEPQYPNGRLDVQGTVVVGVIIDETGRPAYPKIIRPLGLGLDEQAIAAVEQWRFSPALRDGKPVAFAATIEVNFRRR